MEPLSMSDTSKNDAPSAPPQPDAEPRLRPNYGPLAELMKITREMRFEDEDEAAEVTVDSAPMTRLVNAIIAAALSFGASAIYVEPDRRNARLRWRIDGQLQEFMRMPKHLHKQALNRLKLMADIPYWHLAPQTGIIRIKHANKDYNLQLQTTAVEHGEYLTLHVIESRRWFSQREQNVPPEIHAVLEDRVPEGGLFLMTGPPDSGKTTMAYSWLNKLNDIERVVATVENTPSFNYGGMVQTYYNGKAAQDVVPGIIRNLQTQPVNVLYVDDVNDGATLSAVLDAAEDGILTFASLTASSIPHAIKRLRSLANSPERLGEAISGLLFQVLVGRICPDCREEVPFDHPQQMALEALFAPARSWQYSQTPPLPDLAITYRGAGCETCRNTGILGRIGLFGYVNFNDDARRVLETGDFAELKRTLAVGMATEYLERGARLALWDGHVSLEALQSVLRPVVAAARRVGAERQMR